MKIKGIDYEKCISCGDCVLVCNQYLFIENLKKEKEQYKFDDPHNICVKCGHCISICPPKAILYEDADEPYEFKGTKNMAEVMPYDELMKILRMRRTMRIYKDEPVPKEQIEKVLEAMRYAPSGSNRQNWRYTVVTNKEEINHLRKGTTKVIYRGKKLISLRRIVAPFLPYGARRRIMNPKIKFQLNDWVERIERGEDIIFFNAPCVIIIYSRKYIAGIAGNDAGIAFTYGMLAAQSIGLGTAWIGVTQRQLQANKKLAKHFKTPKGFIVWGVMTLGIPDIQYRRAPPRRPLRIQWME